MRRKVLIGLAFASCFSLVATLPIAVGWVNGTDVRPLLWVYPFYFAAGAAGGALVGLLAPMQHRYLGRVLSAYLVVYLVYGGGTVAFLPLLTAEGNERGISLPAMLGFIAVVSLFLAPVYERVARSWRFE